MNLDISAIINSATELFNSFLTQIPNILLGLLVLLLFYFLANWVRFLIKRALERGGFSPQAGQAIGRIGKWATLFFGAFTALAIVFPSLEMAAVFGSLGIGGVAIGFAFRDVLQNFFAGILLLVTEPFSIGDAIEVDGFSGTVRNIETRATTIETFDGRQVIMPNATVLTKAVLIFNAYENRRFEFTFGIGYGDDVGQAMEIIKEVLANTEGVLIDPEPQVYLDGLGDFAVNIGARWWVAQNAHSPLNVKSELLQKAYGQLVAAGIDLPFPTQQILFHDQTEETDGQRDKQREGWPSNPAGDPGPRKLMTIPVGTVKSNGSS